MKIQLTPVTCYEIRGVDGTTATFVRGEQWHGFTELRHPKLGTLIVELRSDAITRFIVEQELLQERIEALVVRASPDALAFIGLPEEPAR